MVNWRQIDAGTTTSVAALGRAAAFAFFVLIAGTPQAGRAQMTDPQTLESELLIALGDVKRLADTTLPEPHSEGLFLRLSGALGVLPWLLQKNGDPRSAQMLSSWQGVAPEKADELDELSGQLANIARRHPLNLASLDVPLTAASVREAAAIHDAYCAGCHDDMGNGDPDLILPARDLFQMAREEPQIFLARLINGIKGDETLHFLNPLTDQQLGALWKYYLFR